MSVPLIPCLSQTPASAPVHSQCSSRFRFRSWGSDSGPTSPLSDTSTHGKVRTLHHRKLKSGSLYFRPTGFDPE